MIRVYRKLVIVVFYALFLFHCHNANSLAREGLKNLEQGKKITALKFFEEALDANKKNPLALYGKGKIMTESPLTMSLGQKMIESALPKLEPGYKADAVISLGKSYAVSNLYNKAIKILASAIAEGMHEPEIYLDLSFYYGQLLEHAKARSILLSGIQNNPKSAKLLVALANFDLKYQKDIQGAIRSMEKAQQMQPEDKDILKNVAWLYYRSGNNLKAIENLNTLKALQTDNGEKLTTEKWINQIQTGKWQINPQITP